MGSNKRKCHLFLKSSKHYFFILFDSLSRRKRNERRWKCNSSINWFIKNIIGCHMDLGLGNFCVVKHISKVESQKFNEDNPYRPQENVTDILLLPAQKFYKKELKSLRLFFAVALSPCSFKVQKFIAYEKVTLQSVITSISPSVQSEKTKKNQNCVRIFWLSTISLWKFLKTHFPAWKWTTWFLEEINS